MWVRLTDRYINTDHIVHIRMQGTADSATGVHYSVTYSDGRTEELNERLAEPLVAALSGLVDTDSPATGKYPEE
jgi:hypothetical protein